MEDECIIHAKTAWERVIEAQPTREETCMNGSELDE